MEAVYERGAFERPAVLFDFDGTIADTGPAVLSISRRALAARGYDLEAVGDLRRVKSAVKITG